MSRLSAAPYQKIFLPTDLSAEGERAFASVAALARHTGARLVLPVFGVSSWAA